MSVLTYTDKDGNELEITPNTEWVNYGDINPKIHGGMFVHWDNDMWYIIETTHGEMLPNGYISDSEILIQEYWVEPMDLFVNGDPDNGPTDYFSDEIESVSNVSGYVNALVDFDIEYFLMGITQYHHGRNERHIDQSEYWDALENHGIPVEKFQ